MCLKKKKHIQLYLSRDSHCKAMQEILSSSNKYLVPLQSMLNIFRRLKITSIYEPHSPSDQITDGLYVSMSSTNSGNAFAYK
jgi:hypothetical protein